MGDQQAWGQPNGALAEENPTAGNPNPSMIGRDRWDRAEDRTVEIMCRIQPTAVSETRRKAAIDYIQRLVRGCLGVDDCDGGYPLRFALILIFASSGSSFWHFPTLPVFPFGSVPLKTYLPDGDIDLSAFSTFQNVEEALANDIRLVLEAEEQNKASEFEVRDVQYIHAEVKLVKCLVQNIVVDISVNQLGGLCTLCFLEQVDRTIAKEHLFKRSIILIKAWCYYESRILGAHHGLISTYALETLVLYIFQHFHSCLHGPLEVLYRFLDYFSKFDWDNYCVSLNGPVPLSALPEMAVEAIETDGGDLLLSKEFLKKCSESYSVPTKMSETIRSFHLKHLNVVDPLKENNNLGRSVSRGNFYRIRSAFTYGARKLGRILLSSEEDIEEELTKFFVNTLDRHGSGQRPDVQDPNPSFAETSSGVILLNDVSNPDAVGCREGHKFSKRVSPGTASRKVEQETDRCDLLCKDTACLEIEDHDGGKLQRRSKYFDIQNSSHSSFRMGDNSLVQECDAPVEGTVVSRSLLLEDTNHLAGNGICVPTSRRETKAESSHETCTSSSGRIPEVPHLQFSQLNTYPGQMAVAHDPSEICNSAMLEKKVSSWLWASPDQFGLLTEDAQRSVSAPNDGLQPLGSNGSSDGGLGPCPMGTVCHSSTGMAPFQSSGGISDGGRKAGGREAVNQLSDLTGDFDSHEESLSCGRWYYESTLFGPIVPFPAVSSSYVHNRQTYEGIYQPSLSNHMYQFMPANGMMMLGPHFSVADNYYHRKPPIFSGGFNPEDLPKSRGTGTYFPNMHAYRERQPAGRGRHHPKPNHAPPQTSRVSGCVAVSAADVSATGQRGIETRLQDRGPSEPNRHEPLTPSFSASSGLNSSGLAKLVSPAVEPVHPYSDHGKAPAISELPRSRPVKRYLPSTNGLPPTEGLEFGSFGPLPWSALQRTQGRQKEPDSVYTPAPGPIPPTSSAQRTRPGPRLEKSSHPYHLKDEDFPPLSV